MNIKVVSVEVMRQSDKYTIDNLVDSKELMYRAGKGIFESCSWQGKIAIVCGSGNNAGDGYVVAMLMAEKGMDCTVILASEKFSVDGKYYYDRCHEKNVRFKKYSKDMDFAQYDMIVDCLLGTGFNGKVRDDMAEIIEKINASGAFVVCADINSGLNGDTGETFLCVDSNLTVSIGFVKPGLFAGEAPKHIEKLKNCDIGIVLKGEYRLLQAFGGEELSENEIDVAGIKRCEIGVDEILLYY